MLTSIGLRKIKIGCLLELYSIASIWFRMEMTDNVFIWDKSGPDIYLEFLYFRVCSYDDLMHLISIRNGGL